MWVAKCDPSATSHREEREHTMKDAQVKLLIVWQNTNEQLSGEVVILQGTCWSQYKCSLKLAPTCVPSKVYSVLTVQVMITITKQQLKPRA